MNKIMIAGVALLLAVLPATAENRGTKPFVVPEIKEWHAGEGCFKPSGRTRVVYPVGEERLGHVARVFAADYNLLFGSSLKVVAGEGRPGDFLLGTTADSGLGKEGYCVEITDRVTILAPTGTGAFWGTRTVLQLSEQAAGQCLPRGSIRDWPDYPVRGFMLDCGRKFIPLDFLEKYVKIMAYYKMNVFHIHLNDNGFKQYFDNDWNKTYGAFRLESETYPGLAARDGHYTKQEFIDLQKLAESHFVEIIPEIDVPAHSLAFAQYLPEIGSEEYGMDHLDLFHPRTYRFLDGLFKEYLEGEEPVFRGPRVHVGTDEYSNRKKEVVEQFRYFTDYYIRYVESFGKQACVWGALTHARGETPVKSEGVLMWLWHNPYAQPDDMLEAGYKLISIPDGLLYIVPAAGYYYDYLNIRSLYATWTPAKIGNKQYEEQYPGIEGGMFAVWNDHVGNGITVKDIHDRVMPALQTLSVKMWTGRHTTFSFEVFDTLRRTLSEAPGVNIAARIQGEPRRVYFDKRLKPGKRGALQEIGYDYTVEFDILPVAEPKGTGLFTSPHATFYLTDPQEGCLGFAREGYLNRFRYKLEPGKPVSIRICGDAAGTTLYVNGKKVDDLQREKRTLNEGKSVMYYIQTLVFPLAESGGFGSRITDFSVYNYRLDKDR